LLTIIILFIIAYTHAILRRKRKY